MPLNEEQLIFHIKTIVDNGSDDLNKLHKELGGLLKEVDAASSKSGSIKLDTGKSSAELNGLIKQVRAYTTVVEEAKKAAKGSATGTDVLSKTLIDAETTSIKKKTSALLESLAVAKNTGTAEVVEEKKKTSATKENTVVVKESAEVTVAASKKKTAAIKAETAAVKELIAAEIEAQKAANLAKIERNVRKSSGIRIADVSAVPGSLGIKADIWGPEFKKAATNVVVAQVLNAAELGASSRQQMQVRKAAAARLSSEEAQLEYGRREHEKRGTGAPFLAGLAERAVATNLGFGVLKNLQKEFGLVTAVTNQVKQEFSGLIGAIQRVNEGFRATNQSTALRGKAGDQRIAGILSTPSSGPRAGIMGIVDKIREQQDFDNAIRNSAARAGDISPAGRLANRITTGSGLMGLQSAIPDMKKFDTANAAVTAMRPKIVAGAYNASMTQKYFNEFSDTLDQKLVKQLQGGNVVSGDQIRGLFTNYVGKKNPEMGKGLKAGTIGMPPDLEKAIFEYELGIHTLVKTRMKHAASNEAVGLRQELDHLKNASSKIGGTGTYTPPAGSGSNYQKRQPESFDLLSAKGIVAKQREMEAKTAEITRRFHALKNAPAGLWQGVGTDAEQDMIRLQSASQAQVPHAVLKSILRNSDKRLGQRQNRGMYDAFNGFIDKKAESLIAEVGKTLDPTNPEFFKKAEQLVRNRFAGSLRASGRPSGMADAVAAGKGLNIPFERLDALFGAQYKPAVQAIPKIFKQMVPDEKNLQGFFNQMQAGRDTFKNVLQEKLGNAYIDPFTTFIGKYGQSLQKGTFGARLTAEGTRGIQKNMDTFHQDYAQLMTDISKMETDLSGKSKGKRISGRVRTFLKDIQNRLAETADAANDQFEKLEKTLGTTLSGRGVVSAIQRAGVPIGGIVTGLTSMDHASISQRNRPVRFGGSEAEWLHYRKQGYTFGPEGQMEAPGANAKPASIARPLSIEGNLNNVMMRSRMLAREFSGLSQTADQSFTRMAFSFSRVAYGFRTISFELMMFKAVFMSIFGMLTMQAKQFASSVISATETQQKALTTLTGVFKSDKIAKEVVGFARKYAVDTPATFAEITNMAKSFGFIPQIKQMISGAQAGQERKAILNQLSYIAVALGTSKPEQGIEGAVFSIREALSGQFRSLKMRFEIPVESMAAMIGKTTKELQKSPKDMIKALENFLNYNIGENTLKKLAMTYSVQMQNIQDSTLNALNLIGEKGYYEHIVNMIHDISEAFQSLIPFDVLKEDWTSLQTLFEGNLQVLSDLLIDFSEKYVNKTIDIWSSIVKPSKDMGAAKLAKYENIKDLLQQDAERKVGEGKIKPENVGRFVQIGMNVQYTVDKISILFNSLSKVIEPIIDKFAQLIEKFFESDKALLDFSSTVGKIAQMVLDVITTLISYIYKMIDIVNKLNVPNELKALMLFFAVFPIASINILVNSFRLLLQSITLVGNEMLWSQLFKGLNMFRLWIVDVGSLMASMSGARGASITGNIGAKFFNNNGRLTREVEAAYSDIATRTLVSKGSHTATTAAEATVLGIPTIGPQGLWKPILDTMSKIGKRFDLLIAWFIGTGFTVTTGGLLTSAMTTLGELLMNFLIPAGLIVALVTAVFGIGSMLEKWVGIQNGTFTFLFNTVIGLMKTLIDAVYGLTKRLVTVILDGINLLVNTLMVGLNMPFQAISDLIGWTTDTEKTSSAIEDYLSKRSNDQLSTITQKNYQTGFDVIINRNQMALDSINKAIEKGKEAKDPIILALLKEMTDRKKGDKVTEKNVNFVNSVINKKSKDIDVGGDTKKSENIDVGGDTKKSIEDKSFVWDRITSGFSAFDEKNSLFSQKMEENATAAKKAAETVDQFTERMQKLNSYGVKSGLGDEYTTTRDETSKFLMGIYDDKFMESMKGIEKYDTPTGKKEILQDLRDKNAEVKKRIALIDEELAANEKYITLADMAKSAFDNTFGKAIPAAIRKGLSTILGYFSSILRSILVLIDTIRKAFALGGWSMPGLDMASNVIGGASFAVDTAKAIVDKKEKTAPQERQDLYIESRKGLKKKSETIERGIDIESVKKGGGGGGKDALDALKEENKLEREILEAQGMKHTAKMLQSKQELAEREKQYAKEYAGNKKLMDLAKQASDLKYAKEVREVQTEIGKSIAENKAMSLDARLTAFSGYSDIEYKEKLADIQEMKKRGFLEEKTANLALQAIETDRLQKKLEFEVQAEKDFFEGLMGKNFAKAKELINSGTTSGMSRGDKDRLTYTLLINEAHLKSLSDIREINGNYDIQMQFLKGVTDQELARYNLNRKTLEIGAEMTRNLLEQKALMDQQLATLEASARAANDYGAAFRLGMQDAYTKLPDGFDNFKKAGQDVMNTLSTGLSDALVAAVDGDKNTSFRDAIKKMGDDIKKSLIKAFADTIVKKLIGGLFGGLMGGGQQKGLIPGLGDQGGSAAQSTAQGLFGLFMPGNKDALTKGVETVGGKLVGLGNGLDQTVGKEFAAAASTGTLTGASYGAVAALNALAAAAYAAASAQGGSGGGGGGLFSGLIGDTFGTSLGLGSGVGANVAEGALDQAFKISAGVGGFGLGAPARPSRAIGMYGDGALFQQPTLAVVGERGPEILAPTDKLRGMLTPVSGGGKSEEQPVNVNIVNIVDPRMVNEAIRNDPNTVINVISGDIGNRGRTYQMMRGK